MHFHFLSFFSFLWCFSVASVAFFASFFTPSASSAASEALSAALSTALEVDSTAFLVASADASMEVFALSAAALAAYSIFALLALFSELAFSVAASASVAFFSTASDPFLIASSNFLVASFFATSLSLSSWSSLALVTLSF